MRHLGLAVAAEDRQVLRRLQPQRPLLLAGLVLQRRDEHGELNACRAVVRPKRQHGKRAEVGERRQRVGRLGDGPARQLAPHESEALPGSQVTLVLVQVVEVLDLSDRVEVRVSRERRCDTALRCELLRRADPPRRQSL